MGNRSTALHFFFGTGESLRSDITNLCHSTYKASFCRTFQKTDLEHRPRPPNVLSVIFLFITRTVFDHLALFKTHSWQSCPNDRPCFFWLTATRTVSKRVLATTFEVVLALENTSQVTSVPPPRVEQNSVANVNLFTNTQ